MEEQQQEYFRLEMLNSKRCIAIADDMLKSLLKLTPLHYDERYRFRVALSEIVSNSYLHGNCGFHDKKIIIVCAFFSNRIEISVEDEGSGFDMEDVERKYASDGVYAAGGRGLKIVNKFADNVIYQRTDRNTFSVKVIKQYPVSRTLEPQIML